MPVFIDIQMVIILMLLAMILGLVIGVKLATPSHHHQ